MPQSVPVAKSYYRQNKGNNGTPGKPYRGQSKRSNLNHYKHYEQNKPENCLHYESPLSLLFPLVFLFFYLTILSPILQLNSASIRLQYHYRVINKNHRKTLLIGYIHLSIQIFAVPCYDRKRRPQNCFDIISDSINILFSTCLSS